MMIFALGTNEVSDDVPTTLEQDITESESEIVKAIALETVSSRVDCEVIDEIVGGSFTGSTLRLNVRVKVAAGRGAPLSVKTREIVTVPLCPADGTTVTVQLGAVPEIEILPLGIMVVFEDVPTTPLHATVESISEMVKLTAFEVFSLVD